MENVLAKIQAAIELSALEFKAAQNEEKERMKELHEKMDEFQEWTRVMRKHAQAAEESVTLNVGGKLFCTSKSTLLAHEGTFFFHMLSSGVWKPDKAGHYFIDRSPRHFDIILDYLRGQLNSDLVEDLVPSSLFELLCEVDFYQLDELRDILRSKEWSLCEVPGQPAPALSHRNRIVRRTDNTKNEWALSSVAFTETIFWDILLISVGQRSRVYFGVINRIPDNDKQLIEQPKIEHIQMNLLGSITFLDTFVTPVVRTFRTFEALCNSPLQPGDKIGCLLQIQPSDAGPSTFTFEFQGRWSDPMPLRKAGPYFAFVIFDQVNLQVLSPDSLQINRFSAAYKYGASLSLQRPI